MRAVGPGVASPLCPEDLSETDTLFPWGGLNPDFDRDRAAEAWTQCWGAITADLDVDLDVTLDDALVIQIRENFFRFDAKACLGADSVAILYCAARREAGEWDVLESNVEYPVDYQVYRDNPW